MQGRTGALESSGWSGAVCAGEEEGRRGARKVSGSWAELGY